MRILVLTIFLLGTSCAQKFVMPVEEPPFEVTMSLKNLSDSYLKERLEEVELYIGQGEQSIQRAKNNLDYNLAVKAAIEAEFERRKAHEEALKEGL